MGGRTYSKQTGHSKKLARSVDATVLLDIELVTEGGEALMLLVLREERLLELIFVCHNPFQSIRAEVP